MSWLILTESVQQAGVTAAGGESGPLLLEAQMFCRRSVGQRGVLVNDWFSLSHGSPGNKKATQPRIPEPRLFGSGLSGWPSQDCLRFADASTVGFYESLSEK